MKIGHVVFGKNTLNYGMAICLLKNNINTYPATIATAHHFDVLFFSLFWWQHLYDFIDFCEKARVGVKYSSSPKLIVGGFNSVNPLALSDYAHSVVVGDGENVILEALNNIDNKYTYVDGKESVTYSTADITNDTFCYYNESNVPRIEIARGCPYKCKYCQITHIKKYREKSFDAIEKTLSRVSQRRVVLFAPNKTSHKDFDKISSLVLAQKKIDQCPDVRFNDVEKFYNKSIQIGIEGLSERLRFSVGKHLTDKRYREIIEYIINRGAKEGFKPHVFTGYILDLPTECDQDWVEFSMFLDSLQNIRNIDKFTFFFIFNQFMPQPFTPLEDEIIHTNRNYQDKLKSVLYDRKYKIMVRGRLFSQYSRCLSMIATRAGKEFGGIAKNVLSKDFTKINESFKIQHLNKICSDYGGIVSYIGKPTNKPWNIVKLNE